MTKVRSWCQKKVEGGNTHLLLHNLDGNVTAVINATIAWVTYSAVGAIPVEAEELHLGVKRLRVNLLGTTALCLRGLLFMRNRLQSASTFPSPESSVRPTDRPVDPTE